MTDRIERNEFINGVIELLEQRSTCSKGKVGAIAVSDNRILIMGYNGAPSGEPHCLDVGCDIENGACIRTVHAEANIIALSSRLGIQLEGTDIVCSYSPCVTCARLMVNAGISTLYYYKRYRDDRGLKILSNCGVESILIGH